MTVEIRRSIASDYLAIPTGPENTTRRGQTLLIDGEVWAVGCFYFDPTIPSHVCCVGVRPELRCKPKAFFSFIKAGLTFAAEIGIGNFVAIADKRIPRSSEMLEHLGFEQFSENENGRVYRCNMPQ